MWVNGKTIYLNEEEKTVSYVSKVNKKNTFLMENNNKMLYMSKVIKKWV